MRADRLLAILLLLQSRGRMTAVDLAERLEVSERTIYRDLDALSAAGVPVYAERGPGGGCLLRPGYRTDLGGLNESELASLFAGTAERALDALGLGPQLQSALLKLEAGLPSSQRAQVARARARVYVDAAGWFGTDERPVHLGTLRQAVFADRKVRLSYRRGDGSEARRTVEPLGLVVKGGIWYLITVTAGSIRVHRISRIRKVEVLAERFQRPRRFDLAAFWRRWARDFVASIPQYFVRLRVATRALPLLLQIFGERVRPAIEAAGKPRAGLATIDMSFDSLDAACGSLLGLGTVVEVLEPAELRAAVRATAQAVAQLYAPRPAPKRLST